MELEACVIPVKDGDAAAMVAAMNAGGSAALAACAGCHKVTAMQGIENPGTMLLLVEWDSVAAHEAAKASDSFKTFAGIITPVIGGAVEVLHYR
jgi:quinol monooxygenase YgiN